MLAACEGFQAYDIHLHVMLRRDSRQLRRHSGAMPCKWRASEHQMDVPSTGTLTQYLGVVSVIVIGLSRAVLIHLRQTKAGADFLLLRLSSRIKKWTFGLACNANCVPTMPRETVGGRVVLQLVNHAKGNNGSQRLLTQMRLSQKATSFFCH